MSDVTTIFKYGRQYAYVPAGKSLRFISSFTARQWAAQGLATIVEAIPPVNAYNDGRASFLRGDPEPAKSKDDVSAEFRRGYIITRKHARFAATIASRNASK